MKSMLNANTWKERKQLLFENIYSETIKKWCYEDVTDDRRIAINTYNQVMEALLDLPNEPKAYVKVAMNEALNASFNEIASIVKRFGE